jgi:hypothetical protein
MKFLIAGVLACVATGMAVPSLSAQTAAPQQQPAGPGSGVPAAPTKQPAGQAAPQQSGGKVLFSRSTDENGQTTTRVGINTDKPSVVKADALVAEDAERHAVTFTNLDLDVRLRTVEQHIAVRAQLTVRNDGQTPLARIPLQISSTLQWERIRVGTAGGQLKDVVFPVALLKSDVDHTGQLSEAAVPLAQPLAPGGTVQLDVTYSGDIPVSAQRLDVIDTPPDVALHSDWDQISVPFTGLRGFGNVAWYPVASVPAFLGEGVRLFDEIGSHKLRMSGARFRVRLTVEFPHGQAPTVAVINGHRAALTVVDSGPAAADEAPGQEPPGVASADSGASILGFEAPSLFVAIRTAHPGDNATLYTLPDNEPAVPVWTAVAGEVAPFLKTWLGQTPRSPLTVLDLPDAEDLPFEAGALLVAPIRNGDPARLSTILVHALSEAWMEPTMAPLESQSAGTPESSGPAWLSEGAATFMDTLWTEKEHGRAQALGVLEADRSALALVEPSSPGESAGQPLGQAISPVYYRTKAAYVLWMLRGATNDADLSVALRGWNPSQGKGALEKLLEPAGSGRDLSWLFSDWVDADKGLPDLAIEGVFPTSQPTGDWFVAVSVSNRGYAAAEVPVTVRSVDKAVTRRLLVPARGKAVQRILIQGKPVAVQVNDGTTPETQAGVHVTNLGAEGEAPAGSSSSAVPGP